jgi:putative transposase
LIEHGRRRILHFNCTAHPASDWIVQQLREALPLPYRFRYALFDDDAKFGHDVIGFLDASGIKPKRTSFRSPWQNGIAERWVLVLAARCSMTSCRSTNAISGDLGVSI